MMMRGLCSRASARDLVEIDQAVVPPHAILHGLEPFAGQVRRGAMGEMPARIQAHAEDGIARLGQRQEHALIGLRAGMRLHIGETAAEQALGAVDGQIFGDVDILAAAVIALARIAFGIFIGEDRARRFENGAGDDIFGGDQLDFMLLPLELVRHGAVKLGIAFGEGFGEKPIIAAARPPGHSILS